MTSAKTEKLQRTFFAFFGITTIRALTAVSQVVIIAVASTLFGKDEFGRFVICYALARLLQAGSGLGAQSYLLKDIPYRQVYGHPWHSVRTTALFFVVGPLVICILAGVIFERLAVNNVFFYPLLTGQGASVAFFAFFWTILVTLAAYVRALRSSSEAMFLSELTAPLTLLLAMGVGAWRGELSVIWLLTSAGLMLLLVELMMLGWHAWKSWMPVGGPCGESVSFKELRAYWGTVMLNTMSSQIDIVLAGVVLSPASIGLYAVIKRVANVTTFAVSVVVWMYAPKVSRASAANNISALSCIARRSIQFTLGAGVIILMLLLVFLPWWTSFFEIAKDETFWVLLVLMLGGQMLSVSLGTTVMFATQTGHPQIMVKSLSIAVAVVAPLILIAGSMFGVIGVAATQLLMVFLMKWPVRRYLLSQRGLDVSLTVLFRTSFKGDSHAAND